MNSDFLLLHMTVVIGIKVKEGALLVADCLVKTGDSSSKTSKIGPDGIYTSNSGRSQNITGAYFAAAGKYYLVDAAYALSAPFIGEGPNRSDLLSDPILNQHRSDYFERLIAEKDAKLRTTSSRQEAHPLEREIKRLRNYFQLAILLNDTGQWGSSVAHLARVALRLSDNYDPDLMAIDGKITPIETFHAVGKGKEIVNPHLHEAYSPNMNLDRATVLAAESMNLALADRDNYGGYVLVRARKVDGLNTVETAADLSALVMPTEFKQFTDYRFR